MSKQKTIRPSLTIQDLNTLLEAIRFKINADAHNMEDLNLLRRLMILHTTAKIKIEGVNSQESLSVVPSSEDSNSNLDSNLDSSSSKSLPAVPALGISAMQKIPEVNNINKIINNSPEFYYQTYISIDDPAKMSDTDIGKALKYKLDIGDQLNDEESKVLNKYLVETL